MQESQARALELGAVRYAAEQKYNNEIKNINITNKEKVNKLRRFANSTIVDKANSNWGLSDAETGILRPNSKCVIVPAKTGTGMAGEIKDVEMHHEKVSEALPGFNVGFSVKGFNKGDILLIIRANPEKLKVGDIIIFNAEQTNPVIHRIVSIIDSINL
jgi:translation elongation factor EF-1alpha